MKIEVDVDVPSLLKQFNAFEIVTQFESHRDVDDLLKEIGITSIVRYLRKKSRVDFILNELAEIQDIDEHLAQLQAWREKKKGAS